MPFFIFNTYFFEKALCIGVDGMTFADLTSRCFKKIG